MRPDATMTWPSAAVGGGQAAHMRGSRARRGASGSPRSARLRVGALIENDFPARLYYVQLRNSLFDTHVNQESPHNRQVQYCSDAVWGFFEEMKRLGRQDEVATEPAFLVERSVARAVEWATTDTQMLASAAPPRATAAQPVRVLSMHGYKNHLPRAGRLRKTQTCQAVTARIVLGGRSPRSLGP